MAGLSGRQTERSGRGSGRCCPRGEFIFKPGTVVGTQPGGSSCVYTGLLRIDEGGPQPGQVEEKWAVPVSLLPATTCCPLGEGLGCGAEAGQVQKGCYLPRAGQARWRSREDFS